MNPPENRPLPHILVVDDTPENLQVLAEILARHLPCDLSFATDGYQAIDAVKTAPPDLILLDVMMPGMSGFDVCNHLKHSPETITIPILFLTAKTEPEDIANGFKLGAADYITKPFNAKIGRAH
ncbi:MAG: response regulator, partial [Kiritimatiellae bacterium]|nr:response regulator [Kiritimatiellia bacterium]